jgi:hypothetical protein
MKTSVTTALTERRKADRLVMGLRLLEIATKHGAEGNREHDDEEVRVEIRHPSGLRCFVWFSRRSLQPDVHVIPWHLGPACRARLAPSFGEVNQHHGRKATHVARGWGALAGEIERGLAAAADGSAYLQEQAA